jgi:hypothetical protein
MFPQYNNNKTTTTTKGIRQSTLTKTAQHCSPFGQKSKIDKICP